MKRTYVGVGEQRVGVDALEWWRWLICDGAFEPAKGSWLLPPGVEGGEGCQGGQDVPVSGDGGKERDMSHQATWTGWLPLPCCVP